MMFLMIGSAYPRWGAAQKVFDSRTITATDSVNSSPYLVKGAKRVGLWCHATSAAGSPQLTINYEMSYDNVSSHFARPRDRAATFTSIVGETAYIIEATPTPMAWLRLAATGGAGNATDTVLDLYMFLQE